jgi:hypothetical protein
MEPLDAGMQVAVGFFALGVLVIFFAGVLLGFIDFMRRWIG